ncbi:hypothetical protein A1O7_03293 [Cladophialophora yegresii CBS 114405]|uniref:BZIP domain-containing protein n=1 Tax=Cladophialophora yegresii CBS 114405 TaxID=1182544 RepID=W9W476_9EURO|nr:uncharacterized protein A1O7_03293 [Cladophialophora yegresii CBS 114405]EXJ62852.1 hypothetical protein A1O7_03293 [Cladophialophora yegresii CBS 114405]
MSPTTAPVSNTSSRRTTASSQKNADKAQDGPLTEAKSASAEVTPKRPKRTLKLTASQRERKRAIDREAQRSIRLKTKNYIAHLESLVRIMENGSSSTNSGEGVQQSHDHSVAEHEGERARALLSQLRQSEEEVRTLKEMLAGVQKLVGTVLHPADEHGWLAMPSTGNGEQAAPTANSLACGPHDQFENCASVYSHSSDSSSPLVEFGYPVPFDQPKRAEAFASEYPPRSHGIQPYTLQQHDVYNSSGRFSAPVIRPDSPTSDRSDAPKDREEGELFLLSDREVNRALAGGHQSFANQLLDEDIIVRAVLHGWRDVQDQYLLDKGWRALRSIDQNIFRECGVVERMAILYMMRLKLLHQSNTNLQYLAPLPPFFQRGPSEDPEVLRKTPIIEHFIWPALRANLCRNTKKYINNKFSDSFRHSFKFVWPYDISHTYNKDQSSQLYSITSGFKQRQWDLRSWTMRREFFTHSSELIGSIPVYEAPMDRILLPAGLMASQRAQAPRPVTKTEQPEAEQPPISLGHANSQTPAPAPAPALAHIHGRVPTTAPEVPAAYVPYSAGVEAWLGDPDMVPQYWNMSTGMAVGYQEAAQQWPSVQRGFVG